MCTAEVYSWQPNLDEHMRKMHLCGSPHRETVMLPAKQQVNVVQPLPQPPSSHAIEQHPIPPPVRLFVDVLDATAATGSHKAGTSPTDLYTVLTVSSSAADLSQQVSWGMVTRSGHAYIKTMPTFVQSQDSVLALFGFGDAWISGLVNNNSSLLPAQGLCL